MFKCGAQLYLVHALMFPRYSFVSASLPPIVINSILNEFDLKICAVQRYIILSSACSHYSIVIYFICCSIFKIFTFP